MFLHAVQIYFTETESAIENKHPRNDVFFSTDNAPSADDGGGKNVH